MLRPFKADPALCDDGDLSGPLLFAFALGSCHLLARGVCLRLGARVAPFLTLRSTRGAQMGKVNFGYILGWSVLSMVALNWLVNLLAGPSQARSLRLVFVRAPP